MCVCVCVCVWRNLKQREFLKECVCVNSSRENQTDKELRILLTMSCIGGGTERWPSRPRRCSWSLLWMKWQRGPYGQMPVLWEREVRDEREEGDEV